MRKPKRRWSWTDKNLRSSRNVFKKNYKNAPLSFRKAYIKRDRSYDRMVLRDEVIGKKEGIVYSYRTQRHSAGWDFW